MLFVHENFVALCAVTFIPLLFWIVKKYLAISTAVKGNTPPGPLAIPILGHLHLIGSKSLHIICEEFSRKYGDIFSLQLASRKVVVLCNRKSINDALVKNAKKLAGRPDLPTFSRTRNGKTGLSLCDASEKYQANRKATVRAVHMFLQDQESFNNMLENECLKMLTLFDEHVENNYAFYPFDELEKVMPSIILQIMLGKNVNYSDPDFIDIVNVYKKWFEVAEADNPADFIPFLLNFPNKRLDTVSKCALGFEKYLDENLSKENTSSNSSCVASDFMNILTNGNNEKLSLEDFNEMAKVISDIIGAGFDTSAATLTWAIIYLVRNQDVLNKCLEEIESHEFDDSVIRIQDKERLPYLTATVYEIIRLSTVAPLGVPHCVAEDISLDGFDIEKDTIILPHLYMANRDPNYWNEPDKMKPERFLTDDNQIKVSEVKHMIAFSAGVRHCPGEQIAISMMFVVLGSLLKSYNIKVIQPPTDMLPKRGMTLKPKHYTIQLSHLHSKC